MERARARHVRTPHFFLVFFDKSIHGFDDILPVKVAGIRGKGIPDIELPMLPSDASSQPTACTGTTKVRKVMLKTSISHRFDFGETISGNADIGHRWL